MPPGCQSYERDFYDGVRAAYSATASGARPIGFS